VAPGKVENDNYVAEHSLWDHRGCNRGFPLRRIAELGLLADVFLATNRRRNSHIAKKGMKTT
jgi:hypothetical protein